MHRALSTRRRSHAASVAALLSCLLAVLTPVAAEVGGAVEGTSSLEALITDSRLAEISGLAGSRRHAGVLWAHNDSDDDAQLVAIGPGGAVVGTLLLEDTTNVDWEDMASFELDGTAYLLVADTGDNGGIRTELTLTVVEEPAVLELPAEDAAPGEGMASVPAARPAWTLRFRWPDGPRDCEAVAVDVAAGKIYLVAKKRVPPEVWQVPLRPSGSEIVVAERVGTLAGVVQPSAADLERNPVYGRYRSQITGIDIRADGSQLAALNYRAALLYRREPGEAWEAALARQPLELPLPWLPQAEAIAFDPAGDALWISSEKLPAPLLRVPIPR